MRQNVSDNDNTKQSEKEALFRMKLNKTGSNFYLAKKEEEK